MKHVPLHFLILIVAGWLQRRRDEHIAYLLAENAVYKEHFVGKRLRLTDAQRRKLAVKGKAVGRKELARIATIGTPDTILRWYRRLVAKKYDGSSKRGPGRPRIQVDVAALIVRMANENSGWGYTRIRGALKVLGMQVGRTTIQRVLADHGRLSSYARLGGDYHQAAGEESEFERVRGALRALDQVRVPQPRGAAW
jgi:hypothetical protein